MTILFKCDKVIRSMKNKIVKKGERKSMKKRKYLALLLAAGMIAQTALSTGGVVQVQAAEDTYVKTDELTDNDTAAPKKDSVIPSKNQYEYQKQELAAFCHFGMNTYTGSEWGNGKENPNQFQLTNDFDEETYVKAIHDAGFKKLIITAKHHDGFCLWPTATTKHSVASSPWKNGQGDVVKELRNACDKYDMKFGVYLSPWDRNAECYGDSPKYNEFFIRQLTELLTNYGEVHEVWFDGANGEGPNGKKQIYDWDAFYKTIQQLQPKAVMALSLIHI